MKRLVEENLRNFKRGLIPSKGIGIGYDSEYSKEERFSELEKKCHIETIAKERVLADISRYEKAIDEFINFGVNSEDLSLVFNQGKFMVKIFNPIAGSWALGNFLTEEDAKKMMGISHESDIEQLPLHGYKITHENNHYWTLPEAEKYIKRKHEIDASK